MESWKLQMTRQHYFASGATFPVNTYLESQKAPKIWRTDKVQPSVADNILVAFLKGFILQWNFAEVYSQGCNGHQLSIGPGNALERMDYIDALMQDCSNSSALEME